MMKKLIFISSLILFSLLSFSQKKVKQIQLFNFTDTTITENFSDRNLRSLVKYEPNYQRLYELAKADSSTVFNYAKSVKADVNFKIDKEKIPEVEGMVYFNPYDNFSQRQESKKQLPLNIPNSARFYLDLPNFDSLQTEIDSFTFSKPISELYQPFYFKKTEVTNKEYREFVTYVKDSIARRILSEDDPEKYLILDYEGESPDESELHLNWSVEIPWQIEGGHDKIFNPLLEEMLIPENERFYGRRAFDVRELMFEYKREFNPKIYPDSLHKGENIPLIYETINCYPDTLVFINSFKRGEFLYPNQMYFWHPAYDDYPVVGISYEQVKAFCVWKTKAIQKQYGTNFEVSLPSEIEWDYVSSNNIKAYMFPKGNKVQELLSDKSWKTDLSLTESDIYPQLDLKQYPELNDERDIDIVGFKRKNLLFTENSFDSYPTWDWADFTNMADLSKYELRIHKKELKAQYKYDSLAKVNYSFKEYYKRDVFEKQLVFNHLKQNIDINGLSGLGNNVSEWMTESYQSNWKDIFEYRQFLLFSLSGGDATILAMLEKYYNNMCDKDGQLVRGANWLDERQQILFQKNKAGMNAKTFVSPNKSYSTVGFRYVIKPTN